MHLPGPGFFIIDIAPLVFEYPSVCFPSGMAAVRRFCLGLHSGGFPYRKTSRSGPCVRMPLPPGERRYRRNGRSVCGGSGTPDAGRSSEWLDRPFFGGRRAVQGFGLCGPLAPDALSLLRGMASGSAALRKRCIVSSIRPVRRNRGLCGAARAAGIIFRRSRICGRKASTARSRPARTVRRPTRCNGLRGLRR